MSESHEGGTPRVEAFFACNPNDVGLWVDFARQLERELDAAEQHVSILRRNVEELQHLVMRSGALESTLREVRGLIEPYAHRDNPGVMQAEALIDKAVPR